MGTNSEIELESEDPSENDQDLGTAEPLSLSDDLPMVTPVTETVFSVLTSVSEGYIVVQPPYQRRSFWDKKKKASLIESIFLGLPLPLFYLADAVQTVAGEKVRTREVVDGQQRITSLRDFYRGDLVIPDDSIIENLRGKVFSDLQPSLKQVFKDFKLSTATIPLHARADKFELFRRLNQQSTVLSPQELRNAAYHGEYLDKIKSEAERMKDLLRVTDAEYRRMKDVEYLTRLLAFERLGYQSFPNKKLNLFLNNEMAYGHDEKNADHNKRIARVEKSLERVKTAFGDLRFRPYRLSTAGYEGEWATTVNRSLMEAQSWAFLDHARYGFGDAASFDAAIKDKSENIIQAAQRLHAYNLDFNDSIQLGTSGTPKVVLRFSRYHAAVAWALEKVSDGRKRRFFSPQQKQNIWDSFKPDIPTCSECGNLLKFGETEVDHIKPFSAGGETVESNGQLLHISCNRAKGAKWDPGEAESP